MSPMYMFACTTYSVYTPPTSNRTADTHCCCVEGVGFVDFGNEETACRLKIYKRKNEVHSMMARPAADNEGSHLADIIGDAGDII